MSDGAVATGTMSSRAVPRFELENVAVGPDPLSMEVIAATVDVAVLVLLRDHHCPMCRWQVKQLASAAEEMNLRDAAVIPILPNSREKAETWQERYDLPFPLLADPEGVVGDELGQTVRFGHVGKLHNFLGRMPMATVVDCRGEPRIVDDYDGDMIWDRPDVEDVLASIDEVQSSFVFDCALVEC